MNEPSECAKSRSEADRSAFLFGLKFWMRPPDEIDNWSEFVELVEADPEIRAKFISLSPDMSRPSLMMAKDLCLVVESKSMAQAALDAVASLDRP